MVSPKHTPQTQEEYLAALMRRLGITETPTFTEAELDLSRLVITEPLSAQAAGSKGFADNISVVGVLNNPLVTRESGESDEDEAATFRVVAGRRRVLGAQRAGMGRITCRIYAEMTPALRACMVLSENIHRASAWVEELKALRLLVSASVGMTERDIAAVLGVPVTRVREQLRLCSLPAPLLDALCAGGVPQATAKQIARLRPERIAALLAAVEAGEQISAELVERLLKAQVDLGLLPLQAAFAQMPPAPTPTTAVAPVARRDTAELKHQASTWKQHFAGRPGASTITMYLDALIQEIAIYERTAPAPDAAADAAAPEAQEEEENEDATR